MGFDRVGFDHPPDANLPAESLSGALPDVIQHESAAQQTPGARRNQDLIWLCELLQSRRQIWRLAYKREFERWPLADEIADNDEPACNPDTYLDPSHPA